MGAGLVTVVLCAACIPSRSIEVPGDVEWMVWVRSDSGAAPRTQTGFDGRLAPAQPFVYVDPSDGWLAGYSTAQLTAAGLMPGQIVGATVRLAASDEVVLPSPVWVHTRSGGGRLPPLTVDGLVDDEDEPEVAPKFLVGAYQVEGTADRWITGTGAVDGKPIVIMRGGRAYELGLTSPRYFVELPARGAPFLSIQSDDQGVVALSWSSLWTGPFITTLTETESSTNWCGRCGILGVSEAFGPIFARSSGDWFFVLGANQRIETGIDPRWSVNQAQLGQTASGVVLAAGSSEWNWQWDGTQVRSAGELRAPFALLGHRVLFRVTHRTFRVMNLEFEEDGSFVKLTDPATFSSDGYIDTMLPYDDGALVAGSLGRIRWLGATGKVAVVADVALRAYSMHRMGEHVLVVTQNRVSSADGSVSPTNVTVYVLSPDN